MPATMRTWLLVSLSANCALAEEISLGRNMPTPGATTRAVRLTTLPERIRTPTEAPSISTATRRLFPEGVRISRTKMVESDPTPGGEIAAYRLRHANGTPAVIG
jgi:hypothetical protein